MQAIQLISSDLFDKVRSRFSNLEMGNKDGAVTIDPAEARFFDFDFVLEGKNLGRISININDPGALKIYYSQGITENLDDHVKKLWYRFLKEMRFFAKRRLLRFDTRDISKSNLDKDDFQYLAAQGPKEPTTMNMNESRWSQRSSKKTSRRVQGKTEVIVRHRHQVNEMLPADRSRPGNILAIFIQNSDGERFKSPFNYLPLAFALAQHIDHGGVPHDAPAKKIIGMCEEMAKLQEFKKHVRHSTLHDDALKIVERSACRLRELKTQLEALGKKRHYESWIAEFNEQEMFDDDLIDLTPAQMEDYRSKFTQREFNEELTGYFPLIHRLMREKIDLEEYVNTQKTEEQNETSVKESEFGQFEQWAESVEQGRLDLSQLNSKLEGKSLVDTLADISLGANGLNAWATLSNLFDLDERDQDDEALKTQLAAKAETADQSAAGLDGPVMDVFKSWIEDAVPSWKQDLPELFASNSAPEPEPQPEPQPAPIAAPQQPPVAPAQPVAEGKGNLMMKEIAEIVKKFYNASNESVGPIRNEESVCLEVEKAMREKYGDNAAKHAEMIARKFMERLTKQWEATHHKHVEDLAPNEMKDEGLSVDRLKELLGNVKAKVEAINPKNPRDYEIPAFLRKEKGQEPLTPQDVRDKDSESPTTAAGLAALKSKLGHTDDHSEKFEEILKLAGLIK